MLDRKELDKIIQTNRGNYWWKPDLFSKYTLDKLPKELEILESPPEKNRNYNCFIYILGLSDDKEVIKDSNGFIYDTLIQKWINNRELSMTDKPRKGDYIIYRDLENYPDVITHGGILTEDKGIISKWAWGPLFKHKIFDVPESYGNNISFIKAITKEKAKELYFRDREFNKKPSEVADEIVNYLL